MAVLQQELQGWLAQLPTDLPLLLAGKSMGGRLATMVVADRAASPAQVAAVVVYGYPASTRGQKTLVVVSAGIIQPGG